MGEIYKITHIESGKIYIGQTTTTAAERWLIHLRDYKYHASHFYHALRKYGADAFIIETIEVVEDALLNEREIYWIALYDSVNSGYNITEGGDRPPSQKGKKRTEETRKKISESKKGVSWGHHSEDTRQRLSEKKKGIKFDEDHKHSLSEAWKTRPARTPETTEKVKLALTGRANIKVYRIISPEGIEYTTERGMNDFCREHGLYITGMNRVAKGKQSDWHGWKVLPPWEAK